MTDYHNEYRPPTWDGLVGSKQRAAGKSISKLLKTDKARAFLLTGPSGVGKTTIARLIARQLAGKSTLWDALYTELDAATRTGVDDMRELKRTLHLKPMNSDHRVICLDEAHMLTKNAWNALLKVIEEPPEHLRWVFCTTEPAKVPKAIRTRCAEYDLPLVSEDDIETLLASVIKAEDLDIPEDVIDKIVIAAVGSPRAALVALAKVVDCDDVDSVLSTVSNESGDVIDLCRFLKSGGSWQKAMKILGKIENPTAEGIRIVVCAYFTTVARSANNEGDAGRALTVLDAFGTPYPPVGSAMYPLLLSMGELLLGE